MHLALLAVHLPAFDFFFFFLVVDFTFWCLSARVFILFLLGMTFLGRGSFNRLRINAPKQRRGVNPRSLVRQVLSLCPIPLPAVVK